MDTIKTQSIKEKIISTIHYSIESIVEYKEKQLTNGGNGGNNLSQLELVKDRCLTSCVKTHHENTHLLLGKEPAEKLGERQPHFSRKLNTITTNPHH